MFEQDKIEREAGYAPLLALADKVASVHGARHPELEELATLVEQTFASPASAPDTRRRWSAIRRLASQYVTPADACNSYRALFRGLEAMETTELARLSAEDSRKSEAAGGNAGGLTPPADACCGI